MLDLAIREDEGLPHDCFYIDSNEKMSMVTEYNDSAGSDIALYVTSNNDAIVKFVLTKRQLISLLWGMTKTTVKFLFGR